MSTVDPAPVARTSRRSTVRSRSTAQASRRTVLIALASNASVTLAKLVGGLASGSAALLAEAGHSVADTVNQVFLLVSIALADREPTPEQPFGYGRVRFLWTFMAAVAMFLAGATFAIGYGVYRLLSSSEEGGYLAAYITLVIALVAEGASFIRAVRQTRQEADGAELTVLEYVRQSRDPNVKMVLFEDSAALIGIVLAFIGVLAGELTGSPVFDPAASIAIGVLLVGVAAWMGHDTSELLVGAAARPAEQAAIERTLTESDQVDEVIDLLTMVLGPNSLLVAARIDFASGLADHDIERASETIDRRLREVVPDVTEVFLDATTAPQNGDRKPEADAA